MALSRPSLASLLTLLKLSLLILVPAALSTHVIMARLYTEIIGDHTAELTLLQVY